MDPGTATMCALRLHMPLIFFSCETKAVTLTHASMLCHTRKLTHLPLQVCDHSTVSDRIGKVVASHAEGAKSIPC